MFSCDLQIELKVIEKTPTKFKGDEFIIPNKSISFYEKFISNFVFYTIQKNTDTAFINEIESMISDKYIRFVIFSFYSYQDNEFFIICFENFCFTILIGNETSKIFAKTILYNFKSTKTHFISPNASDYQRLESFCTEIEEQIERAIYPNAKEQEEIQIETSQIISSINKKILQIPIFNISKDSILTFMIRRFFFKTHYFFDWNFFEFEQYSPKLKEYKNDEFICLRGISQNTDLALHKETGHLVVLKYKEEAVDFDEFQREKNLYEKVNELDNFVKCYGYVKNNENHVIILVIEFMSGGTVQNFLFQKKKIDKYKMAFQILEGLNLLHLNNIIHRDLHPNNIFINHDLDVFIGDFDCSKIYTNSQSLTTDIGSIIYSSPEVLNSQKYSMSADIYSYGLVLYLIFTESIPYNSKGYLEIINMKNDICFDHYKEKIKNKTIQTIYNKCMKFDQKERPHIADIFDDFIKLSIEQYFNDQLKFFCYLITNKNDSIQNKVFLTYSSLLGTTVNKLNYSKILIENTKTSNKSLKFIIYLANHNDLFSQYIIEKAYLENYGEYNYNKFIINKYIYYHRFYIKYDNFDQFIIDKYYSFHYNCEDFAEYFKHFADLNNSKAQYILGELYLFSRIQQNVDKAIYYLNLSSENNDSNAQMLLGIIYYSEKYGKLDINKSIYLLKLSIDQGNHIAAYFLGVIYYEGKYVLKDINKAIGYLTISANHNNVNAQHFLGFIYLFNENGPNHVNKSLHYLTLSANQNEPDAAYDLGFLYFNGKYIRKDIIKSLHYLTISANQDHSDAQRLLSLIYYEGLYVQKDIKKAINHWTISANKNISDAQYNLGYIYYYGIDVKKDIDKSIYYLEKSANKNFSYAQYLLGVIYYENTLIKRDINKALYYLNLSAQQNNSKALFLLGFIHLQGSGVEKNIKKSIFYFTLSANLNNKKSQYMLGIIYRDNMYTQMDINKSIYYLTLSANNNYHLAQKVIGEIYYKGELISRNISKSIHYLTLSANQNNSEAQYLLGEIYYTNKFVPKDIKKSIHYFKEASCFNNSNAKNFLGIIYKNGDGVEKNIFNAIEYFNDAIKKKNCCFSLFNLSRIYYFGINIEKDVSKAVDMLLKASEEKFLPSYEFLYFICLFDKSNIGKLQGKKNYFYQKIYNEIHDYECSFLYSIDMIIKIPRLFDICSEKILSFIRENDLLATNYILYNSKLIDDLHFTLRQILKPINKKLMPINSDFYEGFG